MFNLSSVRRVTRYILDRSPEIVFIGGGANALVTFLLYAFPTWRSGLVFVAWGVVFTAMVLVGNFRTRAELAKGMQPRPWRTLMALQLLYVTVAWAALTS